MSRPDQLCLSIVALALLSSCSQLIKIDGQQQSEAEAALKNPDKIYSTVLQEATELQGKIVDGWFRGEDSRSLKSDYSKSAPAVKARFACDYSHMLNDNGQDMVHDWSSYVPYSKRADFARKWWSDPRHSSEFVRKDHWSQVIWLHEALMDASELWWRALEKTFPDGVQSTSALAHDAEQDMVAKFKDNENDPPRSFSAFDK